MSALIITNYVLCCKYVHIYNIHTHTYVPKQPKQSIACLNDGYDCTMMSTSLTLNRNNLFTYVLQTDF